MSGEKVYLHSIRHGNPEHCRGHLIYARLESIDQTEENSIMIAATLDYCLKVIEERGYVLVTDPRVKAAKDLWDYKPYQPFMPTIKA